MRLINFKNTLVSRDYCTRFLRPGQLLKVHSQKILFPYSRTCKKIFGEFLPDRATPNFLHFMVHFLVFKVLTYIYIYIYIIIYIYIYRAVFSRLAMKLY